MNIVAWDKINDIAIDPERVPVDLEWAFNKDRRKKFQYHTPVAPAAPIKKVGMGELGELLPAAVLIELEDYKQISSTPQAKREAAARVLTRINSDYHVDVLHADFSTLLGQLVTHTSLTQEQADNIIAALSG